MATAHSSSSQQPSDHEIVQLHFQNIDGRVVVVDKDAEAMILPMEEAIAACRAHKDQARFILQFKSLLARLGEWLGENSAKVRRAFLTSRDAGLLFVVIRTQREQDEALEDRLIDLDLEIARSEKFNLIRMSTQPLPDCGGEATTSFLSPDRTIELKVNG